MALVVLNPRAVHHDYRRVLRRAQRHGCGREPTQSSHDYAATLHARLPDHGAAVDALTRAYLLARYSLHPVAAETAASTRHAGRDLRRALRR